MSAVLLLASSSSGLDRSTDRQASVFIRGTAICMLNTSPSDLSVQITGSRATEPEYRNTNGFEGFPTNT